MAPPLPVLRDKGRLSSRARRGTRVTLDHPLLRLVCSLSLVNNYKESMSRIETIYIARHGKMLL